MKLKITPILLLLSFCLTVNGLKFLFYNPKVGKSHEMYMIQLADLLAKAGHDVINYQVAYSDTKTPTKFAKTQRWEPKPEQKFNFSTFEDNAWKSLSFLELLNSIDVTQLILDSCEDQLLDQNLISQLKSEKFDFAFTEFMNLCGFLMFERIGIERYGIVSSTSLSMSMASSFGLANSASFVPDTYFGDFTLPFSFMERLQNILISNVVPFLFNGRFIAPYTALGQKYLRPDFEIMEKTQKSQLIFVNVDEHLDFPRPISHKMHYIGGIGMQKPEPLNEKYAKILEKGDKFIYISFGTMAPSIITMPNETKAAFLEAFSRFPHIKFLWKYEKPEEKINEGHENVILEEWWPQHTLLAHPKIVGFITHGGMNSVSEASQTGVPLITIPLFGDQYRNAKMAEFRGFGVILDSKTLTANAISDAIRKITENESFKQKAHNLASLIKAKPYNSEQTFLRYSEFGAKFDLHEQLDLAGRSLNSLIFYNFDVYLAIYTVILLILLIFAMILRCAAKFVWKRVMEKKSKSE